MKRNGCIIAFMIFTFCVACIFILSFTRIINPVDATPTTTTTSNVSTVIAQTAQMASTQTAMAIPPTVVITSTNLPTLTQPPVIAPTAIETSPITPILTLAIINFPTNTVVFILPTKRPAATNPPAGGTCSCSSNTYNCSDFSSHASAQACFEYCIAQGAGDIHRLDGDNDGLACENN